jgi:hypothetical protein
MLTADTCPKCDLKFPTQIHLESCDGSVKELRPLKVSIKFVNGEVLSVQTDNHGIEITNQRDEPRFFKMKCGTELVWVNPDHVVSMVAEEV